jgi:hypothetical protein
MIPHRIICAGQVSSAKGPRGGGEEGVHQQSVATRTSVSMVSGLMMATSSTSPPFGSTMCSSGASTIIALGEWASVLLSSSIVSVLSGSSRPGGVVKGIVPLVPRTTDDQMECGVAMKLDGARAMRKSKSQRGGAVEEEVWRSTQQSGLVLLLVLLLWTYHCHH